jgi:hypothetical protein
VRYSAAVLSRLRLPLLCLATFALLGAGVAFAAVKLPKAGTWTTSSAEGGFTLTKGKGNQKDKVYLSGFHLTIEVREGCHVAGVATVLGKFPLKTYRINGYSFPGVGKAVGFEFLKIPAKVTFEGTTHNGSFKVEFLNNGSKAHYGAIEFDGCETVFTSGKRN